MRDTGLGRPPHAADRRHATGMEVIAVPAISAVRTNAPKTETATRWNDWWMDMDFTPLRIGGSDHSVTDAGSFAGTVPIP